MADLNTIDGLVIDMDGVLWRGGEPLPGLTPFFELLRGRKLPFVLATNNATQSPERVQAKLESFGVAVSPEQVLTSAAGAARFLLQQLPPGSRIYAVGEQSLRQALEAEGFELSNQADGVQAVVVGMDFSLQWEALEQATYALNHGALFLGTNPDLTFPTEHGLAPGNGATLAALQAASGREPVIYGKPEPHIFHDALGRLGTRAERTLAVGDRLETDILGGQRAGLRTALVLTGAANRTDLADSAIAPDWVFEDLTGLTAALS